MTDKARTSGLAIASLILGILWIAGLGALLAVILGAVALGRIGASAGRLTGRGVAIAGIVLGAIGLIIPIALAVVILTTDDDSSRASTASESGRTTTTRRTSVATSRVQANSTTTAPSILQVAEVIRLIGGSPITDQGLASCGSVSFPASTFVRRSGSPLSVAVFASNAAASDYLLGLARALAAANTGDVPCTMANGAVGITFGSPSTLTSANADVIDYRVTVRFSNGSSSVITQTERRCRNVVVAGAPSEIADLLPALGCR